MVGRFQKEDIQAHFERIAPEYDRWKKKNPYYYRCLREFVCRLIPQGSRVLEVGCKTGDILAAVKPAYGVGIDVSAAMVRLAQKKYPQYTFVNTSIEDFDSDEKFDYIILINVFDHVYDVLDVFENLSKFCHSTTRVILTTVNHWWDPVLDFFEKIGAKMPEGPHNLIEKRILARIVELTDFSISYNGYLFLLSKYIPVLSFLANSIGVRIWGLNKLSVLQYMILQPSTKKAVDLNLGCSVVIPCHNEEDNINNVINRVPQIGKTTEIIVVNDGSKDNTGGVVKDLQKDYPQLKLVEYPNNRGKGYAVQQGFAAATQEILMILDADMSVPPEELPRFFEPLNRGLCQFVNGTRLIYPMEQKAMRTLNRIGNKIFSFILSFIIQQNLTDTLCGTKALYRSDYKRMKWGLDRWGDFDLLFGAAKMGNRIMEVPVHYMSRRSGRSKMKSFQHGLHLLQACFLGFKELLFG